MQRKLSRLILRCHLEITKQPTELPKHGCDIGSGSSHAPSEALWQGDSDSDGPPRPLGTRNLAMECLADAWPTLPPHIKEAIFTLIDGALLQQKLKGGRT
jgi:hypothetical protein